MSATTSVRLAFFDQLFGTVEGVVCIATANKDKSKFGQMFFDWPSGRDNMAVYIEQVASHKNVWFCVNLLDSNNRKKENCLPGNYLWADLDELDKPYEDIHPSPNIVLESSPGRYQAFWVMTETLPADVCENYSKRLAYHIGADKSGWDLTQLLRVPYTHNFKYEDAPEVAVKRALTTQAPTGVFESLPEPIAREGRDGFEDITVPSMPKLEDCPPPSAILYKYNYVLDRTGFMPLYADVPHESDDWSKRLWRLVNICLEVSMTQEETFAICWDAKCNKYARDGRPPSFLWQEVTKAAGKFSRSIKPTGEIQPLLMPDLVTKDELINNQRNNFVTEYKEWASIATDAIEEYHELSCFILLSSVVSAGLRLKTSFGELYPNLWGLVLGDSTLTRKSTAMEMAVDMLTDIDPSILIATDGSVEGLLTGLSNRPNRVSMFYKDEVTGLFDSMNKKDYLAGMPETFTQLYGVPKILTRLLRKDTITINRPYFIFFGGGIKEKLHTLLNDDYVLSGFLPRFLVVHGETDISRLRRTGPPTLGTIEARNNIMDRIRYLHTLYNQDVEMKAAGQIVTIPKRFEAKLTNEAWARYGDIESTLTAKASESPLKMLALPTFTRLSFSMLKMAMIIAACREDPNDENEVWIDEVDIMQAAGYVQRWGRHSIDLISNTGLSIMERSVEKVYNAVQRDPGLSRSKIMQNYRFNSREMNDILSTLDDRGLIEIKKDGRGFKLWPIVL